MGLGFRGFFLGSGSQYGFTQGLEGFRVLSHASPTCVGSHEALSRAARASVFKKSALSKPGIATSKSRNATIQGIETRKMLSSPRHVTSLNSQN